MNIIRLQHAIILQPTSIFLSDDKSSGDVKDEYYPMKVDDDEDEFS